VNPAETKPKAVKPKTLAVRVRSGTQESRRLAAAVLDVLGGERSAPQAAEALGISVPRYYALEARAVEGLMKACEPRPRGRLTSPEKQLAGVKRELARMTRERDRLLTLVRVAHRTVALAEPKPRKRKVRPLVRARRAAAVLRSAPAPEAAPAIVETPSS
jgi:hypothetical protein